MKIKGLDMSKLDCTELRTKITWDEYWKNTSIELNKEELTAIIRELKSNM